jgi:hypothetical protein
LQQLLDRFQAEELVMPFTMEDFERWFFIEHAGELTAEQLRDVLERVPAERRREALKSLPPGELRGALESLTPEERLAGLSAEEIRRYLDRLTARHAAKPRKSRKPRRTR